MIEKLKFDDVRAEHHILAFGESFTMDLLMEESAELIQAISKMKRYGTEKEATHLAEELADVLIMANELIASGIVDIDGVSKYIEKKYERQGTCTIEKLVKKVNENVKPALTKCRGSRMHDVACALIDAQLERELSEAGGTKK